MAGGRGCGFDTVTARPAQSVGWDNRNRPRCPTISGGRDSRNCPWCPTVVLTTSSLTGKGLDEVWAAILEHRARLEEAGELEARRARQQREWLWALVAGDLEDALRNSTAVKAIRARLEAEVESGELSALEASEQILAAFATDAPAIWKR
ncbi:hypothetical protein [Propionicimonas sp.]|uniref:hypothetical protein n=1 Tax=Propionicimonas sp. TaxID=1955623 RepID=UPI0025D6BDB9|nr:hypothetical protein [Propionicimonas sp.]